MSEYIQWVAENPVLSFIILFLQYVILFTCYYQKRLRFIAYIMAVPFVIQDAIVNVIALTILFLELPQEWLVTERLKRWKKLTPNNVIKKARYKFAWGMCDLLNKYDPEHC